jgi:hypothetical protein
LKKSENCCEEIEKKQKRAIEQHLSARIERLNSLDEHNFDYDVSAATECIQYRVPGGCSHMQPRQTLSDYSLEVHNLPQPSRYSEEFVMAFGARQEESPDGGRFL